MAHIYGLKTSANREDQVFDFVSSKMLQDKTCGVYSLIRAHGMRGYIFIEAEDKAKAESIIQGVPYAKGVLPKEIQFAEIEHMLELVKVEMNIRKNDIVEIISGPFKRENARVTRINKQKDEVVVELLNTAVPIPMTLKMDAVKVVRREDDSPEEPEE